MVVNSITTANALQINTNGTFQVNSGAYMTITSGLASSVNFSSAGPASPIVLPVETDFFYNTSGGNTNFGGASPSLITGPGSLVLSGNNAIFLNTGVNSYTGGTFINAGTVINNGSANFGTGAITFNGGAMQTNAGNQTFSNPLNLGGPATFNNNSIVFTGPINLNSNVYLVLNNNLFLNGVVSGQRLVVRKAGRPSFSITPTRTPAAPSSPRPTSPSATTTASAGPVPCRRHAQSKRQLRHQRRHQRSEHHLVAQRFFQRGPGIGGQAPTSPSAAICADRRHDHRGLQQWPDVFAGPVSGSGLMNFNNTASFSSPATTTPDRGLVMSNGFLLVTAPRVWALGR